MFPKKKRNFDIQDKKHLEYIARIIEADLLTTSHVKASSKGAFYQWCTLQRSLFKEALIENVSLREKCILTNGFFQFRPAYSNDINVTYSQGEVLHTNCFTETFVSMHDMDTWALQTKVADIMLLTGITPIKSCEYFVHIKNHFVSHEMMKGIIQFDIYRCNRAA